VLLAVPDGALAQVAKQWTGPFPVLHCSGALTVDVLRPLSPAGSFHPLMTFPGPEKAIPDLTGVPAVLDGDPAALAFGKSVADALGMHVLDVPGDRRLYHAAAVLSGNFATVLLAHAAQVLEAAGVPRDQAGIALLPLALESLRNAAHDPAGSLTGPIARGDDAVVESHRAALADVGLTDCLELYDNLSTATRELHSGKLRSV
jgi:predicted short-subunit dehydrogenase-like oxidoreductase (DUF2520 family)